MTKRILCVDDDSRSLKLLSIIIESAGYQVELAQDGIDAWERLSASATDLIITDILMPNGDGYFLCNKVRTDDRFQNIPIIVYSGTFTSEGEENVARQMGADAFLRKPAPKEQLLTMVKQLLLLPNHGRTKKEFEKSSTIEVFHKYNASLIEKLEKRNAELETIKGNLEQLVMERTRKLYELNDELAAANEELRALNEEHSAINEQLTLANEKIQAQSDTIIRHQRDALEKTAESLSIVLENTKEEMFVTDQNGKILFFNRTADSFSRRFAGQEPSFGMYLWDVTIPSRKNIARDLIRQAAEGNQLEVESVFRGDVDVYSRSIRYSPVKIKGEVKYIVITAVDTSEKKKSEEELKRFENNLKAIFSNTTDGFALTDESLQIVACNAVFESMAQSVHPGTISRGINVLDTLSPEEKEYVRKRILTNPDEKLAPRLFYNKVTDAWFDLDMSVIKDDQGMVTGYCITLHEVTDIKRAENEIRRLNQSLSDFQNAIHRSSIVSMTDTKGNITFVNDNFVNISGFSREELIGQNHRIINSGFHPQSFWNSMLATISSGYTWRNQVKNRRKDGTIYWVDSFITPLIGVDGKITDYLSIRSDITEVKEAEEELIQKRVLLEEASTISKIGYWVTDQKTNALTVSPEMLRILGVTQEDIELDRASLYRNMHLEDIPNTPRLTEISEVSGETLEAEFRIVVGEGDIRWIHQRADFSRILNDEKKTIGTVQDITERKVIEETMKEYSERFELLSKATNDAIWDWDIRTQKVTWNHALYDIFGYQMDSDQFSPSWSEDRVHPDDKVRVVKNLENEIYNRRQNFSDTYRFQCADGSYKHVHSRSYILYLDRQPIRIIGSIQDITESVNALEEIRKLSFVASQTSNAVMITDSESRIEWINEGFVRMTGYEISEVQGMKPIFLQGEDTDAKVLAAISDKLKKRQIISEELVNYTKDKRKFWLKLDISPVFDENGVLKNFISIQTDITELKEFERSITAMAKELANLIESANVPIFGIDNAGFINEWNQVTSELIEIEKGAALGSDWRAILRFEGSSLSFEHAINSALSGLTVQQFEVPVINDSGRRIVLLLTATPRRTSSNEIRGVIFVGQNITELIDYRQNLERKVADRTRELNVALDKEKELVKMKSQFVSIASHEFRTPLSSIAIAAGFVKKYQGKISLETIEEKMNNIEKQVHLMTHLLDDVLTIGKTEAGKMPVNRKPLDLSSFMNALCVEVTKAAGNTHMINTHEDIEFNEVVSDEKLLRNILINLLTNAIKFSPESDEVDFYIASDAKEVAFTVVDYGIGIPQTDLQNVFEPFYRGGNVDSIQGTGLGLSIIKKAVDLLAGTISVKSVVGKGTQINVKLPK